MRAAQLMHDLVELPQAGGAHRMAFGQQAAAGVDRDLAIDRGAALGGPEGPLAARHQAQILAVDHLGDREAVVQFDHIDIGGRDARGLISPLRRRHRGLERAQVRVAGDARRPAGLDRRQDVHRHAGDLAQHRSRDQHDRGRAIAGRAAVEELKRVADGGRGFDLLVGKVGAHLGQRIAQAIALVLANHRRYLRARRAVTLGMDAPRQAEQTREGQTAGSVVLVVHRAVQRRGALRGARMGHGLDPHRDGRIALATGDRHPGVPKRDAAGGAGALDLGAGNIGQAELVGDDAGQHFLAVQRAADEVAQVQRADPLAVDAGVEQGLRGRTDGELFDRRAGMTPEGRRADAHDDHITHDRSPVAGSGEGSS